MARRLDPDHKRILTALWDLGGKATTRQIAEKVHRSVNGVSQSMGVLEKHGLVERLNYKGGDSEWQAIDKDGQKHMEI